MSKYRAVKYFGHARNRARSHDKIFFVISNPDLKHFRPLHQQNRITQGLPAIPGSFPYQATLIKRGAGPYCGGTVVSGFWVITAAHCTSSDAGGTRYSGNIQVGVGSTRPENTKRHDIAAIIEHPGIC